MKKFICNCDCWNIGMKREKEDVAKDEKGMNTMKVLGQNMVWTLKQIHS
jgi:hypothetical protein